MAVSVWLEQLVLVPSQSGASDWDVLATSSGINEALMAQYRARLGAIASATQDVRFFLPLGFGAVMGQRKAGDRPFLHAIVLSEIAWREALEVPEVLFTPDVFLAELPDELPSELPRIDLEMCRELWLGPGQSTLPDVAMEAIVEAALRGPVTMAVQGDDESTRLAAMNHLFRTFSPAARKDLWWVLAQTEPGIDSVHIHCLSVEATEAEAARELGPCIVATGDGVHGFGYLPSEEIDPYIKLLSAGIPDEKRAFIEQQQAQPLAMETSGYTMPSFWARLYDAIHGDEAALIEGDVDLWCTWLQAMPEKAAEDPMHIDLATRFLNEKETIEERLELLRSFEARRDTVALRYGLSALNAMCETVSDDELGDIKRALKPENRAWIESVQSVQNPRLEKLWEPDPEPIDELLERMRQAGAQTDPFLEACELWLARPADEEQRDMISRWAYECMHTRLFMSKSKSDCMKELLARVEALRSDDVKAAVVESLWNAYGEVVRTGLNTEDVASLVKHRALASNMPELLATIEQEIKYRVASMPWDALKTALSRGRSAYDDDLWNMLKGRTWLVLKTEPISQLKTGVVWLRDQGLLEPHIEDIAQDDRWATISENLGSDWAARVALARLQQEWGDRGRLEKFHEQAAGLRVMNGHLQRAFNESYRPTLRIAEVRSIDDVLSCSDHIHWFCADDDALLSECRAMLPDMIRDWYDAEVDDWESPIDALDELEDLCITLRKAYLIDDEVRDLLDECVAIAMDAGSLHRLPDVMDTGWQVSRMIGLKGGSGEELLARVPDIIDNVLDGPDWGAARSLQRTLESALEFCRDQREEDFEDFVTKSYAVWCKKVGEAFENGTNAEDVLNATLALDAIAGEKRMNGDVLVPANRMGDNGVALLVRMRRNAEDVVELQPAQLARLQKLILLVLPEWDNALRLHDPQGWLDRYGGLFVAWLSPGGRNESQQALEPIFVSLFGTRGIDMCKQYLRIAQPGGFFSNLGWTVKNWLGIGRGVAAADGVSGGASRIRGGSSESAGRPAWMPLALGGGGVVLVALLIFVIVRSFKPDPGLGAMNDLYSSKPASVGSTYVPGTAPPSETPTPVATPSNSTDPTASGSAAPTDGEGGDDGTGEGNDAAPANTGGTKLYVNKAEINIREQPTTDSNVVTKVKQGVELTLVDDAGNGWLKIKYKDYEGYVLGELTGFSTPRPATVPPMFTPPRRATPNPNAPSPTKRPTATPKSSSTSSSVTATPPPQQPTATPPPQDTPTTDPNVPTAEPRPTLIPVIPDD